MLRRSSGITESPDMNKVSQFWILNSISSFQRNMTKKKDLPKKEAQPLPSFFLKYVLITCSNFNIFLWVNCINMRSEATGVRGNWIHPKDVQCSNQLTFKKRGRITGRPAALGHPEIIRNDWE